MKSEEFLNALHGLGTRVFTSADAARTLGKGTKYTALFLRRLSDRGRIWRIERGKYYVSGASVYAVASNILRPSYVSLFSAFRFHGITTQNVSAIDIIALREHPEVRGIEGMSAKFTRLDRRRFFGFYRDRETGAFVARVEKAIVDSLYLRNPPLEYVIEALSSAREDDKLDDEALAQFALRMDSAVLLTRLGGAARAAGIENEGLYEAIGHGSVRV